MERIRHLQKAREKYLHAFFADPLANFLIRKLALSPWRGFFYSQILVLAIYALRSFFHFQFFKDTPVLEFVMIDFFYDLILVPATYGFYIWISSRQGYVTYRIEREKAFFADGRDGFAATRIHQVLNQKWLFRLASLLSLLLLLLHLPKLHQGAWIWVNHPTDYGVLFFLKIPLTWIIPWYMAAVIFSKQAVFVWQIRKAFSKSQYRLNLLHPDRCAGLKPLADYLLQFTYYLLICALGILLLVFRSIHFQYFHKDFLVHLAILLYLPAGFFFFHFPLQPLHLRVRTLANKLSTQIQEKTALPKMALTGLMQAKFAFNLALPFIIFILVCVV